MQRLHRFQHYITKQRYNLDVRELIRLCLLGDREGQKLLYERFVTSMSRLCMRYLKDQEEVQDTIIDGFLKVFDMLKTFEYRGERSLEVWIRKIMINQCLMTLRKKHMNVLTASADENLEVESVDGTELSAEEILSLIQTLPEGYRTIFNLFAIDGYSHKEISELLGITESASRSQLTHARNRLKELLKTHGWK